MDRVDFGPLAILVGQWIGIKGLDKSPDNQARPDLSPYTDELIFTRVGPAINAQQQQVAAVKYHHVVRNNKNGQVFHDQIGHWMYEAATQTVMHSLTIPRGVCLLAGGCCKEVNQQGGKAFEFEVAAKAGSDTFGIAQSPFMLDNAKTKAFTLRMTVCGDTLSYRQVMSLHIYGKDFEHEDSSSLVRVK